MIRRLKQVICDARGLTLVELMVGLLVFAVLAISVITVFVSAVSAYIRARDYAEINTMMDNVSALVMSDIMSATVEPATDTSLVEPPPVSPEEEFRIFTTHYIVYSRIPAAPGDSRQVLLRNGVPVLSSDFYRTITLDSIDLDVDDDGVATLTISITPGGGSQQTRSYVSRPVGLAVAG